MSSRFRYTFTAILIVWSVIIALVLSTQPLAAASVVLEPIEDAFVGSGGTGYGDPNRNNGADSELGVGLEDSIVTFSFMKFNLTSIPNGAIIISAQLSIFVTQWTGPGTRSINICHPNANWSENTITGNNMPSVGEQISTISLTGIGRHTTDVTQAVRDWFSGSKANNGLVLWSNMDTSWFGSREGVVAGIPALSIDYTISPDTIDPTVNIYLPSTGEGFSSPAIIVTGTANDNVALSKVEVRVNDGSWQLASGTSSWRHAVTLSPGENTIYVRATDTSQRIKETSVSVTYTTADGIDPSVNIDSPLNGQTFLSPTIIVRGTANDNVALSKVEVRVNDGSWQLASGTNSWSQPITLSPGENIIYARTTDVSQRTKETSVSVIFNQVEKVPLPSDVPDDNPPMPAPVHSNGAGQEPDENSSEESSWKWMLFAGAGLLIAVAGIFTISKYIARRGGEGRRH